MGNVSMECCPVAADDTIHVDGNQHVSCNHHHVSQQRDDEQRMDKRHKERRNKEGLKQTKASV